MFEPIKGLSELTGTIPVFTKLEKVELPTEEHAMNPRAHTKATEVNIMKDVRLMSDFLVSMREVKAHLNYTKQVTAIHKRY